MNAPVFAIVNQRGRLHPAQFDDAVSNLWQSSSSSYPPFELVGFLHGRRGTEESIIPRLGSDCRVVTGLAVRLPGDITGLEQGTPVAEDGSRYRYRVSLHAALHAPV